MSKDVDVNTIYYIPAIDVDTRHYPAPAIGYYRIDVICNNCLNEFCVDIKQKYPVDQIITYTECPNCKIEGKSTLNRRDALWLSE